MKKMRIALTVLTLMALLAPVTLVGAQGPDEITRLIPPRGRATGGSIVSLQSTTDVPSPVDYTGALELGAERLLALQADITEDNAGNGDPDDDPEDGGWDWSIDPSATEHSANSSPENTYGVTAMGLMGAYAVTGGLRYQAALQDAYMGMAARPGVDSCGDFRFLAMLSLFTGDPGPATLAKARYDAKISSYGSATAWAETIRDVRDGQGWSNGIIPWDIGLCAVDAATLNMVFPDEGYDADADAMAEVIYEDMYNDNPGYFDETDGSEWCWALGISGALWAFRAADVHTAEREQLAQTLIDYQNDGVTKAPAGAWDWNDDYGGGDYQTTAYVVMALMTYATDEARAAAMAGIDWLVSEQRSNGSWYWDSYNEYTEEEGEVLSAITLALVEMLGPFSKIAVYGDVTLNSNGAVDSGNFGDEWDLTACPLLLAARVDMTGMVDDFGDDAHAWSELGVRQKGYGNFNPTWDAEGAGVWLSTDYDWNKDTFDPDPPGAPIQDLDDKLILQKAGGHGEGDYNVPTTPPNPWANHGIWFDRDGVDQSQAGLWGAVDGGTYNTEGTYDVLIGLHATSATSGVAFMMVNGVAQGFYVPNWHDGPPDLYPAGMTFTGDMSQMQVFYGLYGYGAMHSVTFEHIAVVGCRYEEPTAVTLASFTAEADAESVNLAWETATEVDNAGFNLYRATSPGGPYTKVNDALIAAQGDPVSGASYSFADTPGYGVFYYKLEDVDYYGVSTLHGPLKVAVAHPFRRPLRRPMLPMLD
jgi:hypothetical protein